MGGKLHVYKRPNSRHWQCSTYLGGRNWRVSTKEESLALAKEVAEDWYLGLRGKQRAGELKKDFLDENSTTLGVEFIGTSISSNGDGYDINERFKKRLAKQPFVKFFNNQRGYVRHVVTPLRWQADFQVIDKVSIPDGHMSTRKSLVVESGKRLIAQA